MENWLNDTDGWVDTSPGNAAGSLNTGVKSNTNSKSVEWNVFSTVVLDDLENERNEEEGHQELNEENLTHQLSAIIATVGWAELSKVMSSSSWEGAALLLTQWESHKTDGTSKHASKDLSNPDEDSVEN